jgi:hypothetical protein
MDILQQDEIEVIAKGREYRSLKEQPGYKRLIKYIIDQCNNREEKLRLGEELEDRASLRLLDSWRAAEAFYSDMIMEIDGAIQACDDKESELNQQGIQSPELMT